MVRIKLHHLSKGAFKRVFHCAVVMMQVDLSVQTLLVNALDQMSDYNRSNITFLTLVKAEHVMGWDNV